MRFSAIAAALLPVVAVSAADILVTVGDAGALAFNPPNITAAEGDNVVFEFRAKNHSVTQSTFASPCTLQQTPMQGIDSGFQFVPANATQFPQWSFTVNNATSPLWFFCAQTTPANHCQAGMVFAINAPPAKSFAAFQAAAKASGSNSTGTSAGAPTGSATASGGLPSASGMSTVVGSASATASGSATGTGSGTAASSTSTGKANSAMHMGGSAASLLALVGVVAGLVV